MHKGLITGIAGQVQGLKQVIAWPFPHSNPCRCEQFFCSNWARQIAAIEAGKAPPAIKVRNLEIVNRLL